MLGRQALLTNRGGPATFAHQTNMKSPALPVNLSRVFAGGRSGWPRSRSVSPSWRRITTASWDHSSSMMKRRCVDQPTIRQLWPVWRPLRRRATDRQRPAPGQPHARRQLRDQRDAGLGVYHAFNLVVHLLAALTLFAVVRRTLAGARSQRLLARDKPPQRNFSSASKRGPPPHPRPPPFPDRTIPRFSPWPSPSFGPCIRCRLRR